MNKFATMVILVMLGAHVGGCRTEQQKPNSPAASGQSIQDASVPVPRISYAEIVALNPTSENPMILQYSIAAGDNPPTSVAFRWYVEGTLVDGVTGNVLEPRYFRKGDRVEGEVIPAEGANVGEPYRTPAMTVRNTPPVALAAQLNPIPVFPGDTITVAAKGTDHDNDTVTFEYQWMVNGSSAPGDQDKFSTEGLKRGDAVSVRVTPFDGEERGTPMPSEVLFLSNRHPEITSVPASSVQEGVYSYQVIAKDPDGDAVTFNLVTGPEGMTMDKRSGLVRWELPRTSSGRVEMTVKISAEDGAGGVAFQEYTLTMEMK